MGEAVETAVNGDGAKRRWRSNGEFLENGSGRSPSGPIRPII